MNRIERLTGILLLLQSKPCTSEEIARHFEVSKRTVLRDVQALCEMGVPVVAREGAGGGYSLPEDYSLAPLPLSAHEVFVLLLALRAVAPLADTPYAEARASLAGKLRALLPQDQLPGVERMLAKVGVDVPEREQRAPLLDALVEAAQQQRWVRITYQSPERLSTQHVLPQQVSMQDGYWYCLAFSHERGERRTYRVDRIRTVDPPGADFQPGPIAEEKPYADPSHPEVILALTARGVADMERDRYLGAQIRREPDGSGRLAFRCPPGELEYFARRLAGLGDEVVVEAPEELRQRLAQLGRHIVERYGKR